VVPTPVPGTLFVDPAQSLGQVNPFVFGTNWGPWSAVSLEVMPLAESAGITYLRFPGGNWGDDYDLKKHHIDQLMVMAEKLKAEPAISVRLQGGDVEQAVDILTYANKIKNYNIQYWSIGNEPGLYGEDYDTERYNNEWRSIAEAMLAVDPNITLIGPDVTQFTGNPETDPRDEAGKYWVQEFLRANGDLVDIFSIHRYPFPASMSESAASVEDLRANPPEWDSIIPNLRTIIREETGRDIPVAVTEINSHWNAATGGQATPDSFYNAIWWGDVLGRLIEQRVEIVAQFALQSINKMGGWGLLGRYEARPTYYVYQIYQHFGDELIYASSDDADVSIYAARRADGALTVIIINLGPKEKIIPLQLSGFSPAGSADVWRLDARHMAENIGTQDIVDRQDITLPAQSISLYIMR
jgi:alpha-L-arabinofuranosidase